MNQVEFINRLEDLLQDIPQEEREEALQYYRDYFADAGSEKEEDILLELESPEKVAETIKEDLNGGQEGTYRYEVSAAREKEGCRGAKLLLLILLLLLALPIILPLSIGVFVLAAAILFTCLVIVGVILFAGIIIAGSGMFCLFLAVMKFLVPDPIALALMGMGCLMVALGAAMTVVVWWGVIKIVPSIFRNLAASCRRRSK